MKIKLAITLILMSFISYSQNNVTWLKENDYSKVNYDVLLDEQTNTIYTIGQEKGNISGALKNSFTLNQSSTSLAKKELLGYPSFKAFNSEKLIKSLDQFSTSIKGFEYVKSFVLDEQLALCYTVKKDKNCHVYIQLFNQTLEQGERIDLGSFQYSIASTYSKDYVNVELSKNNKFVSVFWEQNDKKSDKKNINFTILNDLFKVVSTGEVQIEGNVDDVLVSSQLVSNKGDFAITYVTFNESATSTTIQNKLLSSSFERTISSISVITLFDGKQVVNTYQLKDKVVTEFASEWIKDDVIGINGLFGKKLYSIAGFFSFKLELSSLNKTEHFEVLPKDFMEKERKYVEERNRVAQIANSFKDFALENYHLKHIFSQNDGGYIGVLELTNEWDHKFQPQMTQSFKSSNISISSQLSGRGNSGGGEVQQLFYFLDLVVYKVSNTGAIEWIQKINKDQLNQESDSDASSIQAFQIGDEIKILFIDNASNYESNGDFISSKSNNIDPCPSFYIKGVLAIANIDIESGNVNRKVLSDNKENSCVFMIRKFRFNFNENKLIMYTRFNGLMLNKERFGIVKLD